MEPTELSAQDQQLVDSLIAGYDFQFQESNLTEMYRPQVILQRHGQSTSNAAFQIFSYALQNA